MIDGLSSAQTEVKEYVGDGSTLVYDLLAPTVSITTVENWEAGAWVEKTETTHWSSSDADDNTKITFVDNNEPGASVAAKYTFTFEAKASTDSGDFLVLVDTNGNRWAAAADITGADEAPTSSLWTAIAAENKVQVDISGATDAASVAALFEAALDGLTGFDAVFTSDDTAADGTMFFEAVTAGDCADPEDYAIDSETDGTSGLTWAETTEGKTTTLKITYTSGNTLKSILNDHMNNGL